jgi:hypothetical protein
MYLLKSLNVKYLAWFSWVLCPGPHMVVMKVSARALISSRAQMGTRSTSKFTCLVAILMTLQATRKVAWVSCQLLFRGYHQFLAMWLFPKWPRPSKSKSARKRVLARAMVQSYETWSCVFNQKYSITFTKFYWLKTNHCIPLVLRRKGSQKAWLWR